MKRYFIIMAAVLLSLFVEGQTTLTKIFIVRHADRQGQLDDLSVAGVKRANELKRILGVANIDSIFSTNFTRTKKTVAPLAASRGLPTVVYSTEQEVINRITRNSLGKRVLVAGHSNTVSNLIRLCGCNPPPAIDPNIPDTQFDNLFQVLLLKTVVAGHATTKCETISMKYGAVTN